MNLSRGGWAMLHKLRVTMGHRDASYKWKDFVEVDDAHFEVSKPKKKREITSLEEEVKERPK